MIEETGRMNIDFRTGATSKNKRVASTLSRNSASRLMLSLQTAPPALQEWFDQNYEHLGKI